MPPALLLFAALILPLPAAAQAAPSPGLTETLLHIAESAEVSRSPDEVVAVLRAEARAGTAAAAQDQVNRSIAAAVARAQAVPGVRVSTGHYWTGRHEEQRVWQATQSMTLRGGDGPVLLELAGALQEQGLAMTSLQWTLRRDTARAAREEASRLALEALQRRAEAVAGQLGLSVAGLKEVRIDAPDLSPPRPMMMSMARAASPAPPVALAEEAQIAATVSAVAVLRPR